MSQLQFHTYRATSYLKEASKVHNRDAWLHGCQNAGSGLPMLQRNRRFLLGGGAGRPVLQFNKLRLLFLSAVSPIIATFGLRISYRDGSKKHGYPIVCVQSDMFKNSALDLVINFCGPYLSFSSVFIINKTVINAVREHR